MQFLRQSSMKVGLLSRKIERVTQKYPSPNVNCRVVLTEHVTEAKVGIGRYGDHIVQLNPKFVENQSSKTIGYVIAHEKAHVVHKEIYSWPYIVACEDFRTLSQAPSVLTLALAFLAFKYPLHASDWNKPSTHPLFLATRYLMRKSEQRADKTATMDSLDLCEGALQWYEKLAENTEEPSLLERLQRTHPTVQERVRDMRAIQADILCRNVLSHFN